LISDWIEAVLAADQKVDIIKSQLTAILCGGALAKLAKVTIQILTTYTLACLLI
jgi:hypothetical protein